MKAQLAPGIKGTQQIRQIAQQQLLLQQRKLPPGQKVTQLTPVKGGVPTQLLVQSPKAMGATMTVQQIQQVSYSVMGFKKKKYLSILNEVICMNHYA